MSKLIQSFRFAISGIRATWRDEVNFRIEIFLATLVVALGIAIGFSPLEWIVVVGCISAVLLAEMVNTAIENLCDKISPEIDPTIGKVKDIMGGVVFIVSLGAAVAGALLIASRFL